MNEWIAPAAIIAGASILLAIGRWVGSVNSDRKSLKDGIGELRADNKEIRADIEGLRADNRVIRTDIEGLRTDNRVIRTDIEGLRADNRDIRTTMQGMRTDITKILIRLSGGLVGDESPLRLLDRGKQLAQEMNVTAWAASVAVTLKSEAEGKEPYEIQDLCFAYVTDRLSEEMERTVRRCAYQHGLKWKRLLDVLAVVLRDQLLDSQAHQPSNKATAGRLES